MDVRFLTPLGALFAITALAPLAVFALRERRLRSLRRTLGLDQPARRSLLPLAVALAAVPALLGIAAAQPVIETTRTVPARTDAEVFVVIDISRSMLAAADAGAPTRFERARAVALGLREALPEVPFGIASLTDRLLPHVFPTTDDRVFGATLTRAVAIERPPPGAFYLTHATNLNSLRAVTELNYFPPTARKRVLVVLTDGESQPVDDSLARAFRRQPPVETVFVQFWEATERVWEAGLAENGYRPDERSTAALARAASLTGGRVLAEDDAGEAVALVRAAIGEGATVPRRHESGRFPLMPYLTLAALLPLGVVLVRRNAWLAGMRRPRRPALRLPWLQRAESRPLRS